MTARSIRVAVAATLATALSLTAAACSNPDSAKSGSGPGSTSAVVGIAYEPDSLSPLLGYGKDGNSKIFDGLLALDADMKLRPALAAELPEVSDDGLDVHIQAAAGREVQRRQAVRRRGRRLHLPHHPRREDAEPPPAPSWTP
ncbi:hypothetical protein SMICM17S_07578 [Streptomyces microflavus]